ncbi:hypothetical protein OAP74_01390 [bacterium]|nr:hypothetical protein [bacterium]
MLLGLLILFVALALSGIAAYYSIIGLTAIFAAAVIPIIVMGGILEVAKLACTVWLHQNWQRARFVMKLYLVPAVAVLMFITSMGIFGFLSKSHIEQSAMGTEQIEQVKVIDDKLLRAQAKVERWNTEIGRLNRGETSGRIDGLITREQERIDKANKRIQPQIDAENSKVKGLRLQADKEIAQQNKRLGDAQKRTSADIDIAEKRLAQLDKDVAAYTSQGTTTGGVFTADVDNVKKGNQLRASQKPERDALEKAIAKAKRTEIGVASRVQREITNINKRLAEQIKAVEANVAKIRTGIIKTIDSANANIAKYTLEAGSSNKNVDVRIKELELNIENIQPQIDGLREEKFVFEKQYRQFEAEVGPVKYIAQLIYGDNPDQNLLEAAVRWVIILIVAVFDPLAIMMLLAATETFAWRRQDKETAVETVTTMPSPLPVEEVEEVQEQEAPDEPEPDQPVEDGPTDEEPSETRSEDKSDGGETRVDTEEPSKDPKPLERTLHVEHIVLPEPDEKEEKIYAHAYENEYVPNPEIEEEKVETIQVEVPIEKTANIYNWQEEEVKENPVVVNDGRQDEPIYSDEPTKEEIQAVEEDIFEWKEEDEDDPNKRAKRIWKRLNPDDTLKNNEQMLAHGEIDVLPWEQYIDQPDEKLEQFAQSTFGDTFPTHPIKGDTYVKTDVFPSTLHKFNGEVWIEVDKETSTSYVYNEMYIKHIIEKLGSGEYDPELLNDAERSAIEEQLKKDDL